MKHLIRATVVLLCGLAPLAIAQQRGAETSSTNIEDRPRTAMPVVIPTDNYPISFHHIWMPGIKYGFFKSEGLDLAYEIEGRGSELIIVLQGGTGIPHDYMHPIMSNLTPFATVVYYDRRAEGLPKGTPVNVMPINATMKDLDALRLSLQYKRVTLVAHGMGATIAINYAITHPENVKRLVLLGASGIVEAQADIEKRLIELLTAPEQNAYRSALENADPVVREKKKYRVLFTHCFYRPLSEKILDRDSYILYFDMMARQYMLSKGMYGTDLRDQLNKVQAPALIIAGKHDVVTTVSDASELVKGIQRSRLIVFENSGHFPQVEENYMFTSWVKKFILEVTDNIDDRLEISAPTSAAPSSVRMN